ncbi:MAG: aminotransferase class I/II-fold pyridoxal phosphate-dependent enzyme [Pseudomonadales bacterium]
MTNLTDLSLQQLDDLQASLAADLETQKGNRIKLDLTRGKPAADQLALSDPMESVLAGNFIAADGTDSRNYGGLRGLPEARALGAELLDVAPQQVICWGNSSLTLMHLVADSALRFGLWGDARRWSLSATPKLLAPVPGYDRHFTLTESLGIELVTVPMTEHGPDMERVEALVHDDASIKGIWCVPKYSNPTGCIYSNEVVERLARLPGGAAADDFVVLWDNAYSVHDLEFPAPPLASLMALAEAAGTADHAVLFGSTSKITYAGAGLGFVGATETVLAGLEKRLNAFSIGPDKVNQLRHARFLADGRLRAHMERHAALIRPKFEAVEAALQHGLAELDIATWTTPRGGYFVSLDTRPGLAGKVAGLAAEAGLSLTPPGATFPYGNDPNDCNLRIAPTFATLDDVKVAMEILVLCVKLASVQDETAQRKDKSSP